MHNTTTPTSTLQLARALFAALDQQDTLSFPAWDLRVALDGYLHTPRCRESGCEQASRCETAGRCLGRQP